MDDGVDGPEQYRIVDVRYGLRIHIVVTTSVAEVSLRLPLSVSGLCWDMYWPRRLPVSGLLLSLHLPLTSVPGS